MMERYQMITDQSLHITWKGLEGWKGTGREDCAARPASCPVRAEGHLSGDHACELILSSGHTCVVDTALTILAFHSALQSSNQTQQAQAK